MEAVLNGCRRRLPPCVVRAQIDRHRVCIRVALQMPELEDLPDGDGLPLTRILSVYGLYVDDLPREDERMLHHAHFGDLANSSGARFRSRLVGFDSQECPPANEVINDLPQFYWMQGKQFLTDELERLCAGNRTCDSMIIGDVYGIDLYGRLLVDLRGIFLRGVDDIAPTLPRFELARRCLRSGYSYPTPQTLMTDQLWEAFSWARENRIGAFEEDLGPFYEPYICRKRRRDTLNKGPARRRVRYSE
jgi:hypothetical protein